MKKTNSEQWHLILGSITIQGILVLILSFFDDSTDSSNAFFMPLAALLMYLPTWLILKIDFLSKILLSKFISWLFIIVWLILMIAGYTSKSGFIEVTLIGFWLFFFIATPFLIAKEELMESSSSDSDPELKPIREQPPKKKKTTPVPTSDDFYIKCVNCGTTHTNPDDALCSNCGKNMNIKDTNKMCVNCGCEYENTEKSCPFCSSDSDPELKPIREQPPKKKKTTPVPTSDDFYVKCVNCGTTHTNPVDSLCSNCGKNMNIKDTNKMCDNCRCEYENTEKSCPYCGKSN